MWLIYIIQSHRNLSDYNFIRWEFYHFPEYHKIRLREWIFKITFYGHWYSTVGALCDGMQSCESRGWKSPFVSLKLCWNFEIRLSHMVTYITTEQNFWRMTWSNKKIMETRENTWVSANYQEKTPKYVKSNI